MGKQIELAIDPVKAARVREQRQPGILHDVREVLRLENRKETCSLLKCSF